MTHRGITRPLRAGGLLLLGVAAVAAVIGTAAAVSGDGDESAGGRPPGSPTSTTQGAGDGTTTSKPAESSEPTTTTTTASASKPSATSKPGDGTAGQTPGGPAPGPGDGKGSGDGSGKSGDSVKSVSVRIYNNSNIRGLATDAAEDLRSHGWNVVATGNYSDGTIYTTTAYYRPGTGEQAAAEAIGDEFGMRVAPRFEGIADSSPGVIVIVTKDYQGGGKSGGKS